MNNLLLRWLALAFGVGTLTILLAGCIVPDGEYGYDDGVSDGVDYYEPYGVVYGGWGPGYHVAPYRGGRPRRPDGGGHPYRPAPASHPMPSLPSHSGGGRGGGGGGRR